MSDQRRVALASALRDVRRRVAAAAGRSGRPPDAVTLVAVTKSFPADDVRRLVDLGVLDVGENRDQEARAKVLALADLPVRWHFVGRLQQNKCRSVARYAHLVHSVDRLALVGTLHRVAGELSRRLPVLVQVSLDGDPSRGGAAEPDVYRVAAAVAGSAHLALAGLMAVAPPTEDPDAAYARLARVAGRLRREHPQAVRVSAGMSGDFESAVRHGSTHVRIGSALLGSRPPLLR